VSESWRAPLSLLLGLGFGSFVAFPSQSSQSSWWSPSCWKCLAVSSSTTMSGRIAAYSENWPRWKNWGG